MAGLLDSHRSLHLRPSQDNHSTLAVACQAWDGLPGSDLGMPRASYDPGEISRSAAIGGRWPSSAARVGLSTGKLTRLLVVPLPVTAAERATEPVMQ
jgi:hypothetical protein